MTSYLTLHHPRRAQGYYARRLWREDTFYSLLRDAAARHGSRMAARDGRARLSWADLLARVDGAAARLRADGLKSGDRMSVWGSNRLETIVSFLACSREGIACNPSLHRTYASQDIAALLNRLSARALLMETGWTDAADEAGRESIRKSVPTLRAIYAPSDFGNSAGDAAEPVLDPDKVVYLAFTSGTTGAPKCVMHSDNTLLANARDLVRDWKHGADTRLLTLSPLSHHIAWVAVAQWLLVGCELITDDAPQGTSRLDWIAETGATYVMGVPTHAIDLLAEQRRRGIDTLGSVEVFYLAGSPIPPSVADAFLRQGIKPQNVYGMTENSSHQYTHPADPHDVAVSTCGRGGQAYEIRVFRSDDPDVEAAPGEEGQIGGRGAALMLGYFDNQTATEGSFNAGGWFMSGDLGSIDDHGNLTVRGRLKDLIIRGGHNIYPSSVEALALRHDEVDHCAVVPVPDERLGERACIAVIGTIDVVRLLDHLRAQGLSKYDMPEYFLRMDAFPLTPSGKILKRELAERIRSGAIVPEPIRRQLAEVAQ
jgi:acyl-CoA synthetase